VTALNADREWRNAGQPQHPRPSRCVCMGGQGIEPYEQKTGWRRNNA
jgi:hypothetical protein